ncbi:MAG: hypothetical protein ACOYJQ_06905 [Pseudochelatococcus sp.]|jgi:uncharacterized membrane protein|uniref:DUF1254 domain-containing protein n=1 Tax=Pseudochelatococcus sp. TaxID=2020869 RepID=UPI003D9209F9
MKETRALKPAAASRRRSRRGARLRRALAWATGAMLHALVFGLVLGGLVHIVTVFAIPFAGSGDAVTRLSRAAASGQTREIADSGFSPPWPDPAFVTAFCRFDLTNGPLRITAHAGGGFAGLSLYGPGGSVLYAVTDEIANDGELALTVLTSDQAMDEREARAGREDGGREVRFVMPDRRGVATTGGVAVYRALAPLPSLRAKAREAALSLRCDDAPPAD